MIEQQSTIKNPDDVLLENLKKEFSRPVPQEYEKLIVQTKFYLQPEVDVSDYLLKSLIEVNKRTPEINSSDQRKPLELRPSDKKIQRMILLLSDNNLSEEGELFKRLAQGADFFDCGCGRPEYSWQPEAVARYFGVQRYFGIDKYTFVPWGNHSLVDTIYSTKSYPLMRSLGQVKSLKKDGFTSIWMEDDILGAITKIQGDKKKILFYFSGIHPTSESFDYFRILWKEMGRISAQGSSVIIRMEHEDMFRDECNDDPKDKFPNDAGFKRISGDDEVDLFFIKEK